MPGTPSAQYSLTMRVEIEHRAGMLGRVASAIGNAGGTIGAVDLVQFDGSSVMSWMARTCSSGCPGRG